MSLHPDHWYGSERNDALEEAAKEADRHKAHLLERGLLERAKEAASLGHAIRNMKLVK